MPCFFGDADRRYYLKCLARAAGRAGCAIHAYVLMTNHVHLLVTPAQAGGVGMMLQDLGRRYVRVINTLHGRTGTLWEGRFKSSVIDTENYFLACHRYIELNPVRAGIASTPLAYPWSSHAHYASGHASAIVSEHASFLALGASATERQAAFRALFSTELHETTVARIRDAVNTNCPLGSQGFLEMLSGQTGQRLPRPRRGRPSKAVSGRGCAEALAKKLL